jgi:hypothetical protein
MLFPVILFLMVLSPLYIPIAVTVVDGFTNWRCHPVLRPVRQLRWAAQADEMMPAAA